MLTMTTRQEETARNEGGGLKNIPKINDPEGEREQKQQEVVRSD